MKEIAYKIGLALMSIFYILAGTMHFIIPEFYLKLMPPYIPFHKEMVFLSGVAEVLLGFGLIAYKTRRWAAWGVIALLIAVFPANLHAYLSEVDLMGTPKWALLVRLPVQALFIFWAYLYTKEPAINPDKP
jgi:uncharacterized membrane protein